MLFRKNSYDYREIARKWFLHFNSPDWKQPIYKQILLFIADVVSAQSGCLILKDSMKEAYSVKACLDGRHFSFALSDCQKLIQWLKKNRRSLSRQQIMEEKEFFPIKIHGLNFFLNFQAEVCVPLLANEELIGLLVVSMKKNGRAYTEACLEVLDWLGMQLAMLLRQGQLQESLRRTQSDWQMMADLKSQMVANLSHELRTPLTSILGFAELLREEIDGPLHEEQKKHCDHILEGGNRLLRTLSGLVDMAKLEAGQYPLNISQFHLAPLLDNVVGELSSPQDIALDIAIDEETPLVYGDLPSVRQVFRQLLDNALKYTPKGKVEVCAGRKGEMLEICVADTGIGIAPEKLTEVFSGFFQVSNGLTRQYQGPGIGLALSRKMVEAHGGRLWAKSQVGQGSQFYFTLPLKPIGIKHRELAA